MQPGKFDPNGRFLIRGQDYSRGWVDPSLLFRVSPEVELRYRNARVISGDLILTIVGASTGETAIVPTWLDGANLTQTTARIAVDRTKAIPAFVYFMLSSQVGAENVSNFIKGGAQPGLNCGDVEKFELPLPPLPEQQAIAAALSDADGVVAGLERVIAKKRLIKQGAMQDLLTARRRLPGFSGEWEDVALGAIGPFVGGGTPSMARPEYWKDGTIPWVSSSDVRIGILNGADRLISDAAVKGSSTRVVDPGAILFVTRSGILRRFQPVMMNSVPVAINQDIKALLPRTSNYLPIYVFHAAVASGDQIIRDCMKTGTTVESIDLGALRRFTIKCPKVTQEQHAIAAVLSDMDAEIQTLESRLSKARAVKEGMMQNLLTGRVRLV